MKLEYEESENGIKYKEIFDHGCFGDENICIGYKVISDEWISNKDGSKTRIIKSAKLLSVHIQ